MKIRINKNQQAINFQTHIGTIVMIADIITGWAGNDLVINEAIYNSFVMVVLGCFGIAGLEKFANRK